MHRHHPTGKEKHRYYQRDNPDYGSTSLLVRFFSECIIPFRKTNHLFLRANLYFSKQKMSGQGSEFRLIDFETCFLVNKKTTWSYLIALKGVDTCYVYAN